MSIIKEDAWIQSFGGYKLKPFNLDSRTVSLKDIAHSLSMLCRFGGHIREFYSIAQHSVHVADILHTDGQGNRIALIGLLHDASEYALMDLPRPIKKVLPEYIAAEEKLSYALYEVFGVSKEVVDLTKDVVKWADNVALVWEAKNLLGGPPIDNWTEHYEVGEPPCFPENSLPPKEAEEQFLARFSLYSGY